WLCGMAPQDVLVELRGTEPVLWDLAPAPIPVTWAELAEARAGVRSVKHRLVVAKPPDGPVDLAGAAAAGIADTWAGMLEPPMRNFGAPGRGKWAGAWMAAPGAGMVGPPMRNFGAPGLVKWAELLTSTRDPRGWPRLLAAPG